MKISSYYYILTHTRYTPSVHCELIEGDDLKALCKAHKLREIFLFDMVKPNGTTPLEK